MARLTEQKLAIYIQVLKEQVLGLEWEIDELPLHPRYHQIAAVDGPFVIRMRTNGLEEARMLDEAIEGMEAFIARLQTGEALSTVRTAIREYRAVERAQKQAAAAARRAAFAEYGTPF